MFVMHSKNLKGFSTADVIEELEGLGGKSPMFLKQVAKLFTDLGDDKMLSRDALKAIIKSYTSESIFE